MAVTSVINPVDRQTTKGQGNGVVRLSPTKIASPQSPFRVPVAHRLYIFSTFNSQNMLFLYHSNIVLTFLAGSGVGKKNRAVSGFPVWSYTEKPEQTLQK